MPLGAARECCICGATSTPIWQKNEKEEIICHACFSGRTKDDDSSQNSNGESSGSVESQNDANPVPEKFEVDEAQTLKRSTSVETKQSGMKKDTDASSKKPAKTRVMRTRNAISKSTPNKGKSRRVIFKKSATKAPSAVATPVTTNAVYHKGCYYQVGDIVSMVDVEGGIYYAQIKGLLQDQYCQKSAAITWLLPTQSSPEDDFEPSTYIIGPEEDIPRKLDCMSFMCHAPSDYYKNASSPYTTISGKQDTNFIWTRLGPQFKSFNQL